MNTTTKKAVSTANKTEKERGVLEEAIVLWSKTSKNNIDYLSGYLATEGEKQYVVGYYNSNKKNPKEPDIRIYILNEKGEQDHEICSLWSNESKAGITYLSGLTDEKEKVIGFYGDRENATRPLIRVYLEK